MTTRGNPMIRAAETSVFSYGETGNLYVQQPQKGFQDQSLSLTESGRGHDILRQRNLQINYACNLYCVYDMISAVTESGLMNAQLRFFVFT